MSAIPAYRKQVVLSVIVILTALSSLSCSADLTAVSNSSEVKPESAASQKKVSPKEQITFSKQDLASRLGIQVDAIKVSGATPVTWRSGALGCPKPGMSYTQALVPGIWLLLRVNNSVYRYHAVPGGQPFYCPDEFAEPPATGSGAT